MSGEVIGIDGLSDQQREGARLAAAGWRGVDIAEHLGVAQETVSRWRKKPEYIAAIEAEQTASKMSKHPLVKADFVKRWQYDAPLDEGFADIVDPCGFGQVEP